MSLAITLNAGAALGARTLARSALGWTLAATVGAGSGYYVGSSEHESGQAATPARPALMHAAPAGPEIVPSELEAPAVVEPQPPAS